MTNEQGGFVNLPPSMRQVYEDSPRSSTGSTFSKMFPPSLRAMFRNSNASIATEATTESRNWAAKPRTDSELEGLDEDQMGLMMATDLASHKATQATGARILPPEMVPKEEHADDLLAKKWEAEQKQMEKKAHMKYFLIVLVVLVVVGGGGAGAFLFLASGNDENNGERPTPATFRSTAEAQRLCNSLSDTEPLNEEGFYFLFCSDENLLSFCTDDGPSQASFFGQNDCAFAVLNGACACGTLIAFEVSSVNEACSLSESECTNNEIDIDVVFG